MIAARLITEPKLEFAAGRAHIDPRVGLLDHGPADHDTPEQPDRIRLGIVGHANEIAALGEWVEETLASGRARKDSPYKNMWRAIPPLDQSGPFRCRFTIAESHVRHVSAKSLKSARGHPEPQRTLRVTELFADQLRAMSEANPPDVVLCVKPEGLAELHDPKEAYRPEFHDLLKARAMGLAVTTQVVTPSVWTGNTVTKRKRNSLPVQDGATRAWNLFTALYYKAGGTPWRLPRRSDDHLTCYVGISFFDAVHEDSLHTSVAQVFNERGDGFIVRGQPASISKTDRRPFLTEQAAHDLLVQALERFRDSHGTNPARVVIHKTSAYRDEEAAGFSAVAEAKDLHALDLVWIMRNAPVQAFRPGDDPPLRGTALHVSDYETVLYTTGLVPWYGTYPGMYIPEPISLRLHRADSSMKQIVEETLALTKMNWNNTQIGEKTPITVRTADKVGDILRHIGPDEPSQTRYSYFM